MYTRNDHWFRSPHVGSRSISVSEEFGIRSVRGYHPFTEKPPMTFQVALIGTDGIVLASDTKNSFTGKKYSYSYSMSKIECDHEKGIATAASFDVSSLALGRKIREQLRTEDFAFPILPIGTIAKKFCSRHSYTEDRQPISRDLLIVLCSDLSHVYHLQTTGSRYWCLSSTDKQIAGQAANSAAFFIERYYRHNVSVRRLTQLAAHAVLMAGKLNSTGVAGLEILICRKGGFCLLDDSNIKKLKSASEKMDKELGHDLRLKV